jgi:hypothetical protein
VWLYNFNHSVAAHSGSQAMNLSGAAVIDKQTDLSDNIPELGIWYATVEMGEDRLHGDEGEFAKL